MLKLLTISLIELALSEDVTLLLGKSILGRNQLCIVGIGSSLRNGRWQELLGAYCSLWSDINQMTNCCLLLWVEGGRLVMIWISRDTPGLSTHYVAIEICLRYWHSLRSCLHLLRPEMLLRLELLLGENSLLSQMLVNELLFL